MENWLRVAAWFAFSIAALVGYSIGGLHGLLAGLAAVPVLVFAGMLGVVICLGILTGVFGALAWMCGADDVDF